MKTTAWVLESGDCCQLMVVGDFSQCGGRLACTLLLRNVARQCGSPVQHWAANHRPQFGKLCPRSHLKEPCRVFPQLGMVLGGGGMGLLCSPWEIGKQEMSSLGCAALPGSWSPGAKAGAGDEAVLLPSRLSRKRSCVGRKQLNTRTQTYPFREVMGVFLLLMPAFSVAAGKNWREIKLLTKKNPKKPLRLLAFYCLLAGEDKNRRA